MNVANTEKAKRDYQLLRDALDNNNQKAYAELVRLYKNSLYFLLLKMMNNPDDAEDLTLEAFGKAFHNLDKYSPEYAFSTWLYKIAINNCIDYLRKKSNLPNYVDYNDYYNENFIEDNIMSYTPSPEEMVMEKQKVTMLKNVVNQLRPKYRVLIELRYYKEMSYEEIAQELNITISNVKIQLFRAKDMLYNIITSKNLPI